MSMYSLSYTSSSEHWRYYKSLSTITADLSVSLSLLCSISIQQESFSGWVFSLPFSLFLILVLQALDRLNCQCPWPISHGLWKYFTEHVNVQNIRPRNIGINGDCDIKILNVGFEETMDYIICWKSLEYILKLMPYGQKGEHVGCF